MNAEIALESTKREDRLLYSLIGSNFGLGGNFRLDETGFGRLEYEKSELEQMELWQLWYLLDLR